MWLLSLVSPEPLTRVNGRLQTRLRLLMAKDREQSNRKRCAGKSRGYYTLPMSLVWSCKESSLSLSLFLAANYRHMLSTSTCGSPFESQGPRFLWGAVKVHTLYSTISYSNWDSGPQPWNQVIVLCKGTWQASMVCSISLGVHHKIITNIKNIPQANFPGPARSVMVSLEK